MASNIYEIFDNQTSKMQEQLRDADNNAAESVRKQILNTIEVFAVQETKAKTLNMVKEQLNTMQAAINSEPVTPENAHSREITRQMMLDVLAKLVDGTYSKPEEKPVEVNEAVETKETEEATQEL